MAFEPNFEGPAILFESNEDVPDNQKMESISSPPTASENVRGSFDCNICFDSAQDPVVTLCGHLYCWPCIYKWLNVQISPESDEQPKCPVCKSNISRSSLVPLYGRGTSPSESNPKKPQLDLAVPRRPPAVGVGVQSQSPVPPPLTSPRPNLPQLHPNPFPSPTHQFHHQQYFPQHPYSNLGSAGMSSSTFSPTVGMFGEMVFARMFGSPDANLYAYQSSYYPLLGSGSPRVRRQEIQVDKILNNLLLFLFCCFVLCLILF